MQRESNGAVSRSRMEAVWTPAEQRERALASLLADGLLVRIDAPAESGEPGEDHFRLP